MMTILISCFLHFSALKILTGDYFMLKRINKITYSKQKMGWLIDLSIFSHHFSHSKLPIHLYRVSYKWRIDNQVKD